MNKKNYKTNLKRSFIICGIMFVIILLIFVYATLVNRNVAENMTGKLLYINENGSESYVCVYDFDNKKVLDIQGLNDVDGIEDAQFLKDGSICAVVFDDNELRIISCRTEGSQTDEIMVQKEVKRLISYEADRNREKLLVAYENLNGEIVAKIINSSDRRVTDLFVDNEKEITSVCFNYAGDGAYVAAEGKNTLIYSDNLSLQFSIKGDAKLLTAWENGFLLSRQDEYTYVYKFFTKSEAESKLQFCDSHNTYKVCIITKDKFIAGSDKSGNGDIYVCNGSNMDPVEAVNNDMNNIPVDYIETESK